MTMHDFNLLSNDNVAENWKEGEDRGEGGCSVDDQKWDMVDFETVGEISYTRPPLVRMGDDNDFMTAVDELGGQLVNMAFDSSWLWEEVVADHGNIVRHCGRLAVSQSALVMDSGNTSSLTALESWRNERHGSGCRDELDEVNASGVPQLWKHHRGPCSSLSLVDSLMENYIKILPDNSILIAGCPRRL